MTNARYWLYGRQRTLSLFFWCYKLVFALSKAADRLNQIRIFQFCNEIPCGSNRILCNRTLTCVQLVNRNLNRNIFALNRNPFPRCWLQVGQNRSDTADPE